MVFSTRNILSGLVAGLLAVRGVRADDCDEISGPFADVSHFGNRGYTPSTGFCHTKWTNGLVVTGMEVWGTSYHVSGLQLTFSDGTVGPMLGANNWGTGKSQNNQQGGTKKHDIIKWTDKDQITNFKAATSKDGNALGLIHIEVAGKTLTVGEDDVGDGDVVNLGSGVMVGASGTTNSFLSFFTPLFLGTPSGNAQITQMIFDQDITAVNKQQEGISNVMLADVYLKNPNPIPANSSDTTHDQMYSFTGSQAITSSTSLTTSSTNTFGLSIAMSISAKVGIPELVDITASTTTTASYQYSTTTSKDVTSSNTQTVTWNTGSSGTTDDMIKPGHAKHCTSSIIKGSYNSAYTSVVSMTIKGKPFSFKQRGNFDGTSYTNVVQQCLDMKISDIPSTVTAVDASSTVKNGKRAVILIA